MSATKALKYLSVKVLPYNHGVHLPELLRLHADYSVVRYEIKRHFGMYPTLFRQQVKLDGCKFEKVGTGVPIKVRTREPDVDGVFLRHALIEHSQSGQYAQSANHIVEILSRVEKEDHLPSSLAEMLLTLRFNGLDASRKTQGEDSFVSAAAYLAGDLAKTSNDTASQENWENTFRRALYSHVPTAFHYAKRLIDHHGESDQTPALSFYSAEMLDKVLGRTPNSSLQKPILAEKEARRWLEIEEKDIALNTVSGSGVAKEILQQRKTWQKEYRLSEDFFIVDNIRLADAEALKKFESAFRQKFQSSEWLETLSKKRKQNPQEAALSRSRLVHLKKVLELTPEIQSSPAKTEELPYFHACLIELVSALPTEIAESIDTLEQLVAAVSEELVFRPKLAGTLKQLRIRGKRWGTPNENYHDGLHRDAGEHLIMQLQKQKGFEGIFEEIFNGVRNTAEACEISPEACFEFIQIYFGEYWHHLNEKRAGVKWPVNPPADTITAQNVEVVAATVLKGRSSKFVVDNAIRNLQQIFKILKVYTYTDHNSQTRPLDETARQIKAALESRLELSGEAFKAFFDMTLFDNIVFSSFEVSDDNAHVFVAEKWNPDVFKSYIAHFAPTPEEFAATCELYFRDQIERRINRNAETGEFNIPEKILRDQHAYFAQFPREAGLMVFGNGFENVEIIPQLYPLIAREDFYVENSLERTLATEEQHKKGRYLYYNAHSHTTADSTPSDEDRVTARGAAKHEVIESMPMGETSLLAPNGHEVEDAAHPQFMQLYAQILQDLRELSD